MPKVCYRDKRLGPASMSLVKQANDIIGEYQAQGYKLTLRQLYYQFVRRLYIANTTKDYAKLGQVVSDGRLAGFIDWDAIEDRTRETKSVPHWEDPSDIIGACERSFRIDKWEGQRFRPEVWIEKEALAGVVEGVCSRLDISFLSCRGYTSQSEMWSSAMRLKRYSENGQEPVILHFGDHDPSGMDMTRDVFDRLEMFTGGLPVKRMALNMDQVEEHKLPENPAKMTDSRFEEYREKFGESSWELDALEPQVLVAMIEKAVLKLRDEDKWEQKVAEEAEHRTLLKGASTRWDELKKILKKK